MRRAIAFFGVAAAVAWITGLEFSNRSLSRELRREQAMRATQDRRRSSLADLRSRPAPSAPVAAESGAQAGAARTGMSWNDPAWTAARFNEAYLRVESRYGRFLAAQKDWPADKLETLKRSLASDELAVMRAATPAALPVSDGERAELGAAMQRTMAQDDEALKAELGEADYEKLKTYAVAQDYRGSVDSIANSMRAKGLAVDDEQEEAVLNAYAVAAQHAIAQASAPGGGAGGPPPGGFDHELLGQLSKVLNEQQVDAFMQSQLELSRKGSAGRP